MLRAALLRIGQALGTAPEMRGQVTAWSDWSGSEGQVTASGASVSTTSSLQLLTVYGCNRFIADGISTLPVDVLRRRADGSPEPLRTPQIIAQPTADLNFASWCTQVLTSLLLAGNAYIYKGWSNGNLVELLPLDPTKVEVRRVKGQKWFFVEGMPYSTMDIGHIPGVMFPGSDIGLSPVDAARQTIGVGLASKEYGGRHFGQGTTLSGVIEVPVELTPDQARELARSWSRSHGGKSKSHLPGVLQGGATWKPTQLSNEQSQFLETQGYTASEIAAQMFQIDPAEMGLPVQGSSLTYANLEQRNARKVQVTFLPWITRLEAFLTGLLPRPQYVKLNVNGLLRGDTKTRFDAYAVGITNKFLVPNEAREFEDWQPLPGGDEVVDDSPDPAPMPDPAMNEADRDAILGAIAAIDSRRDEARTAADAEHRADMLRALRAMSEHKEPVTVNLPEIRVPDFHFDPPVVNVTVDPTPVHVDAPTVTVESPTVNVEAPAVTVTNDVQPSDVTLINPPRSRTVQRDQFGNIVRVVEE